jgi:hypothetical protein
MIWQLELLEVPELELAIKRPLPCQGQAGLLAAFTLKPAFTPRFGFCSLLGLAWKPSGFGFKVMLYSWRCQQPLSLTSTPDMHACMCQVSNTVKLSAQHGSIVLMPMYGVDFIFFLLKSQFAEAFERACSITTSAGTPLHLT